eukprot:scaffold13820_cov87-Phaeocystis_antarctica.AAC.4
MDAFDLVSKERVNILRPACRSCRGWMVGCDKWHGCGVTRCDGCSALAACDGQSWRLAPWHSRGRERGSVAHVVAARLLDPRVHVVGVSQPTLLEVISLR